VDGIIVGRASSRRGRQGARWIQDTWVLTASPEESLAEFFLEDYDGARHRTAASQPVVCRGIAADGTLVLGPIHLSSDRFLSEFFSNETEAGNA